MNRARKLAALALLGFASISMWGQDDTSNAAPPSAKPTMPESRPGSAVVPPDYMIGADDTLHITVWKEPEMSATLPVRPDGKISLPLLDDVQAAGMTPMQLAGSIKEKLKKYIADPRVTVVVTAMNSQRIFVAGEVNHPGAMALVTDHLLHPGRTGSRFRDLHHRGLRRRPAGAEAALHDPRPVGGEDRLRGAGHSADLCGGDLPQAPRGDGRL